MNRSMPSLPVHHQIPESTQTHVHWVSDAIQPSHPLSSLLLLPPIPPSIRVFSYESILRMKWPKYWNFRMSLIWICVMVPHYWIHITVIGRSTLEVIQSCKFLLSHCIRRYVLCAHRVWLFATPWSAAHQALLSLGFPRQEYWSGFPFPSPIRRYTLLICSMTGTKKVKSSRILYWKVNILHFVTGKSYEEISWD